MTSQSDRPPWMGELWRQHSGFNEAAQQPGIAAQSDHDLAVWRESKQHSWTVNTVVLTTIRDHLREGQAMQFRHGNSVEP